MENAEQKHAMDRELLIRIDERTKGFREDINELKSNLVTRKEFDGFQGAVAKSIAEAATKEELKPIKKDVGLLQKIVYGMVGTIVLTVLIAILGSVIAK